MGGRILDKGTMEERNNLIVRLHDKGLKFDQIAPQVRLSRSGTEVVYYKRKHEHETVNK